jgi:hypothetical protein
MTLIVTLRDGRQEAIQVPPSLKDNDALFAFTHAQGPFQEPWVRLLSNEYVRMEFIVSVRVGEN